jgi:ribosomal protein S18 acetylase RimI-like enzyme
MSDKLKDFSTEALTVAIKANLFKYYEYLGQSPKAEIHEDPYLRWVFTSIPHSFLNNVLCTQLTSANVDEVIQQTLASLRSRNITKLSWWTEPGTQPLNLGEHLVTHGLTFDQGAPGMAVDLLELREASMPSGLTIKRVDNANVLREFVHSAAIGFGLPEPSESICFDLFAGLGFDLPLNNYVGYLSGEPVATAEMFLGAGVAGIYWVSTVPEARQRGIGSAMTWAPLRQACEMGYQIGILHSSDQGIDVYRKLGFVEKCRMGHYVWNCEINSS